MGYVKKAEVPVGIVQFALVAMHLVMIGFGAMFVGFMKEEKRREREREGRFRDTESGSEIYVYR
jgi:hypothetical protein